MNKYISRGIDYRGHLASRLRELEGFDTLAYELIQNADDAEGVSKISFDITNEALIVENDGKFSDCGKGGEQQECSWQDEKGHMCDFHRFRKVSSDDKRRQEDTTGAFGIGFSVVYQITDQPELISSGRHWIIREWEKEDQRIKVCSGCDQCQKPNLPGTRFIFPWARDKDSELRRSLNLAAVDDSVINELFCELDAKLPIALLFLRRIKRIELKRDGKVHKSIERIIIEESQSLIISYDQGEVVWHLFTGEFDAQKLRNQYQDKIEAKRSSKVTVAIPEEPLKSGLLCSTLPTRHESGLPFHINADFFTTSNRKDVILDGGYQAEWNRAAIQKAASIIGDKLENLASLVGHEYFWSLIASIKEVNRPPFKVFWDEIKKRLSTSKIVYTLRREWVCTKEAFLLSKKEDYDAASVLQGLGLCIVHNDLEPYRELLEKEAKVSLLSVQDLISSLEKHGLKDRDAKVKEAEVPQFLKEPKDLERLWRIIGRALKSESKHSNVRKELAKCSIALTRDRSLHRCDWVYSADNRDDVELFEKLGLQLDFLADEAKDWDEIKNLCRKLDANTVIIELKKLTFNEWQPELENLLKWFKKNGEVLKDENLKKSLSQLHIFPAHQGGLRPLDELVLPGGFEDPLGVTDSIDVSKIQEIEDFLQKLGLQQLSLEKYITQHLPQAFQSAPPPESIKKVIEILVKNFENIKGSEKAKETLRRLHIIECDDGKFYKPEEAYFPEILVEVIDLRRARIPKDREVETHKLYEWLGVNERVRVQDLIDGIRKLTSTPPTVESKRKVQAVWEYLSMELNSYKEDDKNEIKNRLSSLRWLPAQGTGQWLAPNEIYSTLRRNLFCRSQAQFLDIPDEIQKKSKDLLGFLGVKIEPEVGLVVEHLLNSAKGQEEVDSAVYDFLNKHANDYEIQTLKDKPCLLIEVESQKKYVRPNEVFWKKHSLEPFRYTLDQSWEDYGKLLRGLGVREEPDYKDAIEVLREIAQKYGENNSKLDDRAYAVVEACWSMIAEALKNNNSIAEELQSYSDEKIIPDRERLLKPPSWMYIVDRTDLASKFKELEHNLIPRIEDLWRAWHAAGAKMLSECVRSEVQAGKRFEDEVVLQRLQERQLELKRVLDSFGGDILKKEFGRLLQVKCYKTDNLQVRYILDSHETSYEETKAHLKEKNELYYVLNKGDPPWLEIARELAQAICPDQSGPLATGFYEVLATPTREEARNKLDILGYLALEEKPVQEEVSHEPARLGASSAPKLDKKLEEPPMIEKPAIAEGFDRTIPSPSEVETKPEERPSQFPQPREQPRSIPGVTTYPMPQAPRRRDQSRFPVYVSHQDEAEGREAKGYAPRDQEAIEVEEMAIKRVMQFEQKEGRRPERKPRNHPGYDIESRDASGDVRYIEVKGLTDKWGTRGIALTDKQFQTAQEKKDQYWLYIVEHATQENSKIYCIQDPANKVNQFFYDDSWKQVAEVVEETQQD